VKDNITGLKEKESNSSDDQLFKEYFLEYQQAKANYYRHVLRKDDELVLKKIQKIPDDWESTNNQKIKLSDQEKKRLTDIKQKKSWELKFESIYIYFFTNIEEKLIDCLNYVKLTDEEFDEVKDSISSVLVEIGSNLVDFKYLSLSLAKRSVSDLYYLMASYSKFYRKKTFVFETDFYNRMNDGLKIFDNYHAFFSQIDNFLSYKENIEEYFKESSTNLGWKMDEFKTKKFFEKSEDGGKSYISNLMKIIQAGKIIKDRIKLDFDFLIYYYNKTDGKLYRYNFVTENLKEKFNQNIINEEIYHGFKKITDSFIKIKNTLKMNGLKNFGPENFKYIEILTFLYKGTKIVEYYYLVNQQYDNLRQLRSDFVYHIEKEYFQIMNISEK